MELKSKCSFFMRLFQYKIILWCNIKTVFNNIIY